MVGVQGSGAEGSRVSVFALRATPRQASEGCLFILLLDPPIKSEDDQRLRRNYGV